MFEQIARIEAWTKANGPRIRGELEDVAIAIERGARALELVARELSHIRRAYVAASNVNDDEPEVIEGVAREL